MTGQRTLIIGLGATGYSCLKSLHGRVPVAVCDTRANPPYLDAARTEFADTELLEPAAVNFDDFDRAVISPGIGLDHCLARRARDADLEILGDIDLFLGLARAPVIAITGTNGKSTVASMVGKLLDRGSGSVRVGGNLGVPALDLLDLHRSTPPATDATPALPHASAVGETSPAEGSLLRGVSPSRSPAEGSEVDWYVLELSSFQLERMGSGAFDIAAVLNISADHLDRHGSFDAYVRAKRRVYLGCRAAVYDGSDPHTRPPPETPAIALNGCPNWRVDGDEVIIDGTPFPLSSFQLGGRHNAYNVLAASAIASLTGSGAEPRRLFDFPGLPHRSAFVGSVGSVRCIDDSKATNVGACVAALNGFGGEDRDIVLIAGGDGKNASFEPLKDPVARHAKHVVLIGRDAPRIEAALAGIVPVSRASDMDRAVAKALAAARGRGTILLSPACASFDMFDNFEARGDAFRAAVDRAAGTHG
ncbi:MAG: UDP-N-acetylmuramoyl-L-alanine--D-glutamate ligase [Gammaproteobacteria bacterium]|nr:UDP-N-acetylmuramoyl-L-alanine--D-glutamate ligase [Gammaproteobacteria bacterium]